jgi:predicted acetyltransferase
MTDYSPVLRPATGADRAVLERLWLMYRHDLSEFRQQPPSPDGTFPSGRLDAALGDPGWAGYLIMIGDRPAGLALVRGVGGAERVLSEFFVVRACRRHGVGLRAVEWLVTRYPGRWSVAFQADNLPAARFWPRVAARLGGDGWTLERRAVPGRPDLPPDLWIAFRTGR